MARKTYPENYNYGTGAQPYYHMSGVDALPRVSSASATRAAGYDSTTRFFDEKTNTWITPAQQQAKTGVLPTRIKSNNKKASQAQISKALTSLHYDPKTGKLVTMAEKKAAAKFKGPSRAEINDAVRTHKTLHITTPSSCFDNVSWRDGIVSVAFRNGYFYDTDLDLDTMLEWADDESLGGFFNHVLGQDFFAD